MNKTELIDALAKRANLTKATAKDVVDGVLAEISDAVVRGEDVAIAGFGSFKTAQRSARAGRNPKTKEAIKIPASTSVRFVAGKALKDAVNGKA